MRTFLMLTLLLTLAVGSVLADVPTTMNYQGYLTDNVGDPVADGPYSVVFTIYDAPAAGTSVWAETLNVTTTGGLFAVLLGTVNAIEDTVFNGTTRYLAIEVAGDPELAPRTALVSVPYAQRVSTVDGASGGNIATKVSIGPGHTLSGLEAAIGGGSSNTVGQSYGTIGGGTQNAINHFHEKSLSPEDMRDGSTIAGGLSNSVGGHAGSIGGGESNAISDQPYATIGGGSDNSSQGPGTTVSGGVNNRTYSSSDYATVAGGIANQAQGPISTVSGGKDNIASGDSTTVGGGAGNTASGVVSTVGGGWTNVANGSYSTVGGGSFDSASGESATVSGGKGNTASGPWSTVSGGHINKATGSLSAIGGGNSNVASGQESTVGGGVLNTASGWFSTVPGGDGNKAGGNYSFAAGRQAKASHGGSFVWADGHGIDLFTSVNNQFVTRASGGYYLFSNSSITSGVHLPPGGSAWVAVSDSTMKQNIREVDYQEVLNRVNELPISQWSYRSQDESIEHIGPMAQDFYRLFGLGEDDRHISTLDPDGISLAAIKGLKQIIDVQQAQIDEQQGQIDELKTMVQQLADASKISDKVYGKK